MSNGKDAAQVAAATAMLAQAARPGCIDLGKAREALAMGANPDAPLPDGMWLIGGERPNPLQAAFRRGDQELGLMLMEAGAKLDGYDGNGKPTVFWLSGAGDELKRAWIACGGDPWRMFEPQVAAGRFAGERKSLALISCRGGGAELWSAIASAFHHGVDLCERGRMDSFNSAGDCSVMAEAIEWGNVVAIEALFNLGYQREEADMARIAKKLAAAASMPRHYGKKAERMASVFFKFGAAPPLVESYRDFTSIVGAEAVEAAKDWMANEFLIAEKKALSKAMRARGTKRPLGGRGRL